MLPSLVLVCPSNWGFFTRTDSTAVSPSRTSSPVRFESFSLMRFLPRPKSLVTLVSARRKPSSWVPPSTVLMLFTNESTFSRYPAVHCRATSISASSSWSSTTIWRELTTSALRFRWATKSRIPPW